MYRAVERQVVSLSVIDVRPYPLLYVVTRSHPMLLPSPLKMREICIGDHVKAPLAVGMHPSSCHDQSAPRRFVLNGSLEKVRFG